jgi:hypothetical protein
MICSLHQYYLGLKSRTTREERHVKGWGKRIGAYGIFVGTPEIKRPLGRPRRRWYKKIRSGSSRIRLGEGQN